MSKLWEIKIDFFEIKIKMQADVRKIYDAIGDLWKKRAQLTYGYKTEEIVTIAVDNIDAFMTAAPFCFVSMTDLGDAGESGKFINQHMRRFRLNFLEVPLPAKELK